VVPAISYANPVAAARIEQVLHMVHPDLVHFHAVQDLGVDMVRAVQDAGVPTVVTLHDAWWLCERQFMVRANGQGCAQTWIDPRVCATCVPDAEAHELRQQESLAILGRAGAVLAPSRYWAGLMGASGVAAGRVRVNANGVIAPREGFSRPPRQGVLRLGYVGGLSNVKGFRHIVRALAELRRSDYELLVVDSFLNLGRPSMSAADWPVSGLVRVIPGYSYENIDEFFASIDVLLFPSQWAESFGLTVREALLRGVWPIVTDAGGPSEVIRDGVNGTLVPLGPDHGPLARAIAALLDDPTQLDGRPVDARIATFAEQAQDLEELYREVVATAGGARGFRNPRD
jgi:glycosyltransferase involved in cell wall biosynthesis